MTGRPGYPLEPLRALRAGEHRAKALDLAEALAAEQVATEAARTAEVRRARAAVQLETSRAARSAGLARGVTAAMLATADAHDRELRARLAVEDAAVARARAALAAASAEVARARGEVTTARAREEVVERHRGRWQDGERKKRDRREEAEADDQAIRDPRRRG